MLQQALADAMPSVLGQDKEVFQIEAGLNQKCREGTEEKSVTDGFRLRSGYLRDPGFKLGVGAKAMFDEARPGIPIRTFEVLELRKGGNEA